MREVRVDQLLGHGDPDRPALTFKDATLSYRELADRVGRLAAGLAGFGVRRGDRVAVYAEKRIDTVVALMAISAAGAAFVPVNPLFKARHLAHVIEDCTPRLVITTAERLDTVRDASPEIPVVVFGSEQWRALGESEPSTTPVVIDQDVAAIMYTSGSTGGPKGVVLSHRNILAGAESVASYLKQRADDVMLAALPLSFDAGFSQLTTSFLVGAHVVLVNYLLPAEIVKLCAKHGVTGLTCVPPLWLQLVTQTWPAESTASLRYFANTGGRMPRATLARLRRSSRPPSRTSCTGSPRRSAPPTSTRPRPTAGRIPSAKPFPTPRSSLSARTARHANPVSPASSCTAEPWWRKAIGAIRCAPPSDSVPCRRVTAARSPSGPGTPCTRTRTASCTSSAAATT